ncbi:MAG: hypothetical protein RKP46_01675 [Candidatus Accumulibacter sp.]|uniref:hypothetical protein n=1 Tax=Accumulibacter sp. TaxID=2053492 RepID=UPI002879A415|nr:hypothetical protein [Accumulibacter sp.]MDS4013045.1 hypothetical protein [Accumulibacter sp.]
MSSRTLRPKALFLATLVGLLVGGLAFLAWQHLYPVSAGDGWSYRVFHDDLRLVSALAKDARGDLYVTQEMKSGNGLLFRLASDGTRQEVVGKLSKPDGLVAWLNGIAISQEEGEQPVLWLHDGHVETLFTGRSIEGLASDGQALYAIEDRPGDGRLLRYDALSKQVTVLRTGLREGEGVALCPNGELYYAEKGHRWIKRWRPQGDDQIVLGGLNAPGFIACNEDGLWIAEDATHRARLLLLDKDGVLHTVLSHLRSAQTLLPLAPDRFLLAEQGRGRLLEITRQAKAAR